MADEPSQEHIWAYFQNNPDAAVYEASHVRNAALLRQIRRLSRHSKPTLLNIGIGDGNLELSAHKLDWVVSSLDPDTAAASRLSSQGIDAKAGSIEAMPFPDNHFDFVVASEVLEHLTDEQRHQGLKDICRTLKPGGRFVGTVPYRENLALNVTVCPSCRHVFHHWGHTTDFDLPKIREVLSHDYSRVSCRVTAFVAFKGRSLRGKVKSLVRLALAKLGEGIAVPNILFIAEK